MKVLVPTLLLGCIVLFSSESSAGGMAVFDGTAHVYASEQLKQLTEQVESLQSQLDEAIKANETLTKSYEAVTGTYSKVKGVYDDVMKTKAFLNDSYNTVMNQYDHYKGLYDDLSDPDQGDIETVKDLLEGYFGDPRIMTPEQRRKQAAKSYQVQQEALKKAIEDGEDTLATMPERAQKLSDLANKIGKTIDTKDAQALTNSLLLEILGVLQEQLALSLRYQQAMALQNYSGVTEEGIEARAVALKKVLQRKDVIGKELEYLRQSGMSDMTDIKFLIRNILK